MNRNATAFLVLLLASGATLATWELGWNGPRYARVLRATPVTVREPHYVDVVESVPAPAAARSGERSHAWDVTYREGGRTVRTQVASEPGDQIRVGDQQRVIGYDVVWRWRERTGVVRLGRRPGKRLPVEDGRVVEGRRATPVSS